MELIHIEDYLRQKMIDAALDKGALSDPDVIHISQQLDRFLVQIQIAIAEHHSQYSQKTVAASVYSV